MVYHISETPGIRVLTPKVSTHKKAYVYGVENLVTGLLFGVRQDDFDFMIYTDDEDRPHICECYPDGMRKKYAGRSCSVYELPEEGFLRGMTSWSAELVSPQEVRVERETAVPDLYQRLLEEEERGTLVIHRYQDSPEYRKMISEHIVDRLIRFDILKGDWEKDERFAGCYRPIIEALLSVTDGHLLCREKEISRETIA
ncbi:MAG: hypothetical protein NC541_03070 [bacterium]|nr:hypothetical protein [bacterium]